MKELEDSFWYGSYCTRGNDAKNMTFGRDVLKKH
jgi:hypothetical protein